MIFKNTREELEYNASDKKIYSRKERKLLRKVTISEMAPLAWPLAPLMNYAKDAYKRDSVYLSNQVGDNPLNCSGSLDLESLLCFLF